MKTLSEDECGCCGFTKAEFPINRLEAKTVKLTDYAESFIRIWE